MRILSHLLALSTSLALATANLEVRTTPGHGNSPGHRTCTVKARGNHKNDVPNILKAFKKCNHGGKIIFPEGEEYYIAERLNPHVRDIEIEWRGTWLYSDNLTYWRANSYPIEFQNHAAGFILSGSGISINGHGTGNINGNGEAWYVDEAGTTRPGRPMPFVFWNVTDVHVSNFAVYNPQLWAINIMNGTDMEFENIEVHVNDSAAPEGENWAQNTDGFDTMDARNIRLHNFTVTGGDDCVAIKPRSYNIHASNVTCNGGNGIAIGSLGQYLEDASVTDVVIEDAKVPGTRFGTYIKTWMGHLVPQSHYESGGLPRGGGWGFVQNITFRDIDVGGSQIGILITQDNGNNGSYAGTSKMGIRDVLFENVWGDLSSRRERVSVDCSRVHPCYGVRFEDVEVYNNKGVKSRGACRWTAEGGVTGLEGCE
ncbi:pectin lyase fold/virulence factor [Aspergillus karnatakaensis]|uniref:putative extracellular exo-polygalacturonase n=1 Tax=Aspergillus karnatakaensis TaxID=1810916 RepID=UPI003CCDB697